MVTTTNERSKLIFDDATAFKQLGFSYQSLLGKGLSGVAYPYMMMECIGSGITLKDVITSGIRSNIRSMPFAVRALMRIARTVEIMNTNEMYHSDIKPANILMDRELCYLGDFGLAQYMNRSLSNVTPLQERPLT